MTPIGTGVKDAALAYAMISGDDDVAELYRPFKQPAVHLQGFNQIDDLTDVSWLLSITVIYNYTIALLLL